MMAAIATPAAALSLAPNQGRLGGTPLCLAAAAATLAAAFILSRRPRETTGGGSGSGRRHRCGRGRKGRPPTGVGTVTILDDV